MQSIESSPASDMMALKIYGERNTGTNYLTELIRRNIYADILPGRVADDDILTQLTRRFSRFAPKLGRGLHEAARDRYFEASFSRNLGWKHMNPNLERIGSDALSTVRFMMAVKNPYAWLLSFHKRPYHVGAKDVQFEDFLQRRLMVMEKRENTGPDQLSPVEVWNRKMRGYLALQTAASHAMIVKYEDFLVDEFAAIERVAKQLELPLKESYKSVSAGVKRADGDISQSDYADYYLQERWRTKLSQQALEQVNSELDHQLVTQLGYDVIT